MAGIELDTSKLPVNPLNDFPGAEGGGDGSGLPKPQDIIDRENKLAAGEGDKGTDKGGEDKGGEQVVKIGNVDLEELAKKVDEKKPLNAEELAVLRQINTPAAPVPEKTFKVNGEEMKFSDALAKAKEQYKLDVELEPEAAKQFVEDWVKTQQHDQAQVTITKRHEQNAEERRQLEEQRRRQREEEIRLSVQRDNIKRREEALKSRKEDLMKRAQSQIKAEEIDTEEKRMEYYRAVEAREGLQRLAEEEKQLKQESVDVSHQQIISMVRGFQAAQPAYRTSIDPTLLAEKIRKGEPVSPEDKVIVMELDQLLREAVNAEVPIEDMYELRSRQGVLAVPKLRRTAQPSASGSDTPAGSTEELDLDNSQKSLAERVREHKAKALQNPSLLNGGGGGADNRNPVTLTAKKVIRDSQAAIGVNSESDRATLKRMGLEY